MRCLIPLAAILAGSALGACATRPPPPDAQVVSTLKPHSGYRLGQALAREALPAGSLVLEGETALQALVEWRRDGGASLRAVAAQEANLSVAFAEGGAEHSAIDVKNASGRNLKLDLFVSRDGRDFAYAESCPVGPAAGAYAQWPQRIVAVAIANPREANAETCD